MFTSTIYPIFFLVNERSCDGQGSMLNGIWTDLTSSPPLVDYISRQVHIDGERIDYFRQIKESTGAFCFKNVWRYERKRNSVDTVKAYELSCFNSCST